MHKRFAVVVATAILLIAGMLSSAVCEMTCLPQASTGACCGRQIQAVHLDHCGHASADAVINGHQCDLPRDNPTTFTADVSVIQLHAVSSTSTTLPILSARTSIAGRHDLSLGAFLKRASITPLRI